MIKFSSLAVVEFQFAYMTRSPFRVREGFLDKLIQNIREMDLNHEELEKRFIALAIRAFGSEPGFRRELCSKALEALEILTC